MSRPTASPACAVSSRAAAGAGDAGCVIVIDNGGGYIRAGICTAASPSVVEPNCVAYRKGAPKDRPATCSEVLDIPACSLHRPSQRGLVLNLDQQRTIFDWVFRKRLGVSPRSCMVLLTEAPLCPGQQRREIYDMLKGDLGCRAVSMMPSPPLALYSPGVAAHLGLDNPCCTVVNVGFSGCIAVPCLERQAIKSAIRRLNVGGRVLTNLLLERLRLRHYDLSDSWLHAEDVLCKMGEVSPDFNKELLRNFEGVPSKSYVLPNFRERKRGHVDDGKGDVGASDKDDDAQRVTLDAERVAVPEALFSPGDHGLSHQAGLAELVKQAIYAVGEEEAWRMHFGQVVLCGGLARLPGLRERLLRDLRQALPAHWPVSVFCEEEPELSVWRGAAELARDERFRTGAFAAQLGRSGGDGQAPSKRRRQTAGD